MSINVYELVTDRIISELEKGVIPWQKPWTGIRSGAYSRSTGRAYSLLNQMLLGKPGEYLTFKQVQEAGGKVKKGEKSGVVVFWKQVKVVETAEDGTVNEKTIPMLKYFNVFHIDQTEGIEPKYKTEDMKPFDPISEAESAAAGYISREGLTIEYSAKDKAAYSPAFDMVYMPLAEQFTAPAEYYSTLFHELTHSTGHASRLNRFSPGAGSAAFGSTEYSKEELIAEIGAACILNTLSIETPSSFKNSAAYIQSWLKVLKNDKRMIVSAAGKAEKAVNLIFG